MNKLDAMQAFVAVVQRGGITAAANELNVAKSVVSRKLSELEHSLRVQLITRTTRSQKLSVAGENYYQACLEILDRLEEAETSLPRQCADLCGQLRIAVPLTFGVQHLTPVINEFLATYPKIDIDINFNDRRIDLIHEGFDVGIRIGELKDSTLVARRFAPINFLVCASPAYLEKHGELKSPDELAQHKVIHYSNIYTTRWNYRNKTGKKGSINIPSANFTNNGDFITQFAINGHGIILQPTFHCHHAVRSGLIKAILKDYIWRGSDAYVIYPQTKYLAKHTRVFIDFLLEKFKGHPAWDQGLDL